MLRILLSMALATLVAVGTSYAQEGGKKEGGKRPPRKTAEERFKDLDANKDGKLTLDELKGKATEPKQIERREKMFKDMDANGDGAVTLEEYKAFFEKMRAERGSQRKKSEKK